MSLLILLVFPIFIYADNNIVTRTYNQNSYTFQIKKDSMLTIMGGPSIRVGTNNTDVRKSCFLTMFNNNSSKCPTTIYHCEYLEHTYKKETEFPENKYTYDACLDEKCNDKYLLENICNSYGVKKNCVEL